MHGPDGAGVAVVSHAGDFAQRGFGKFSIRDDDADGGIPGKFVFDYLRAGAHELLRGAEGFFILRQKAGDFLPGFPVVDIAQGVHRHDGADLQLSDLDGEAADAGLHAVVHACEFSHGGSAAGAVISVPVVSRLALLRAHAGLIGHGAVRSHMGISHGQVKKIGLTYEGDDKRGADFEPDAPLLQILHDAVCRAETVGAAACQQDSVDELRGCERLQKLGFPRRRSAAPDVQPGRHPCLRQKYGAAGSGGPVFRLTDADSFDFLNADFSFHNIWHSFPEPFA